MDGTLFGFGVAISVIGFIIWILITLKRAPILCKPVKDKFEAWKNEQSQIGTGKYVFSYIQMQFNCVWVCLSNIDYMFHTLYVIFAVVGLAYSYLFFIFHLMDLLRIDVLKNIVSAIWIRRVPLVLTFMLFLLLEYYFTLIGFLLFHK